MTDFLNAPSEPVVLLPAGAGRKAGEHGVGFGVVGDALGDGVEGQLGVEALGDDTEGHRLAQRAGDGERRAALLLTLAREQEVFEVVRRAARHRGQLQVRDLGGVR
jgi:hypothetical protein